MAQAKYEEWLTRDGLILLAGWARDGLTDEQMAENMGIARKTLAEWKKKHSDIGDTIKRAKEVADYQVENALFKRATGFSYEEIIYDEMGIEIKKVKKEALPDVGAIALWLKNRRPNKWRDKPIDATEGSLAETIEQAYAKRKEDGKC